MVSVNTGKLHTELETAGIPIHGVASDGRIDFKDEATKAQIALAEQIRANHDPDALTPAEAALKAAKERAEANRANENDIANANTVAELREQMLKMQAQIEYLLAQTQNRPA